MLIFTKLWNWIRGVSPLALPVAKPKLTMVLYGPSILGKDPEATISNGDRVLHCKPWCVFTLRELERTFAVFVPNWQNTEIDCVTLECFAGEPGSEYKCQLRPFEDEDIHKMAKELYRYYDEQALPVPWSR